MVKTCSLMLLCLFLFGCANPPMLSTDIARHAPVATDVKLAEAATNATHSLRDLAEVERAVHPRAVIPPPADPATYGMGRVASISSPRV